MDVDAKISVGLFHLVLWIISISFSRRFNSGLRKLDNGPSSFDISFMFCMSVLFIAPMSGATVMYAVRKAVAPMMSSIQLGRDSWDKTMYVARAESMEAESVLVEDFQSIVAA